MPEKPIVLTIRAFQSVFWELKSLGALVLQVVMMIIAACFQSSGGKIPWWVWVIVLCLTVVAVMFEAFHRVRSARDKVISLEQARLDAVTAIVKDVAASLGQCNADIDPNSNPTPNLAQLRTSLSNARQSLETAIKQAGGEK